MYLDYLKEFHDVASLVDESELKNFCMGLFDASLSGRKVLVIGNGGSSYSASHFAQDLLKVCGIKAISLTDNVGLVTAYANDITYDRIFEEQARVLIDTDDILVAISCSGNSKNVVNCVERFRNICTTACFTALDGGKLHGMCDYNFRVPTDNIYMAESIHSMLLHYVIENARIF